MSYTSRVYEKVLRHDSAWLPQGTDDAGLLARDKYSGSSKLQPSRFCLMLAQVADPQRVNHPHICAIPADRPKLAPALQTARQPPCTNPTRSSTIGGSVASQQGAWTTSGPHPPLQVPLMLWPVAYSLSLFGAHACSWAACHQLS